MKVLLLTVPHTGTRFFIKLIEEATGVNHHIMRDSTEPRPLVSHEFATAHLEDKNWGLIQDYIKQFSPVLLTTIRDKQAVYRSFEKRGKNDGRVESAYKVMGLFLDKYDPLVLSVDAPDRDARLASLSAILGVELSTDWGAVGAWADKVRARNL